MEKGERSMAEQDKEESHDNMAHHVAVPPGLTQDEFDELRRFVTEFHTYGIGTGQCSSLLAQRINAPLRTVWSVVRRFDKPQAYKHFIKSCEVGDNFRMTVGCTRDVNVISGLPAATSTERLDILDDDRLVTGFSITGGEHRLRNYRSVTSVHEVEHDGKIWTVVLESYAVDVPEGNTEEDTRLFADTVVKLNLQKLASFAEGIAPAGDGNTTVYSKKNTHLKQKKKKKKKKKRKG
jgi:abscisic acid receptor (PYR/PYL family)